MGKPVKTAAVLVGLGVGVAIGPSLGPAAVWSGVAIAVLGAALCLVGTHERAAGITGTHRDLPLAPPTRSAAPNGNPSPPA
ncbi:hypothetical protein SAMN05443287_1296 [Micromonospora phaseoli]|uniref:Uncharacterized protein n=1 Tax=Micromonospora phaseoli TaxID=1144548 RepID=A0A1H7E0N4_9ACTN|nr:hypothetical protein CLV64_1263 [Micromonospora phaseoli]GIJ81490.1 hypothetical protein Xph01_59220 [Micromonospora phaseoli]SEK07501.1 hypothetical protein SAMN05443287_1296 [Micromonospora phaseoli]